MSIKSLVTPALTYSVSPDIFINIGKRLITTKKTNPNHYNHHSPPLPFGSEADKKVIRKKVAQETHKFSFLGFSWLKVPRPH